MKRMRKIAIIVTSIALMLMVGITPNLTHGARAEEETSGSISTLAMSPMINRIVLNPGETYTGSFNLTVPAKATNTTHYEITLRNFYRKDDGNAVFEEVNDTGRILNWTKIDSPAAGSIEPNNSKTIYYTITVPDDAPGGGQYLLVHASTTSDGSDTERENSAIIHEKVSLGHIVYAEITGNTIHQGEIVNTDLPSFMLGGDITASTTIKNTGNVHGIASYKLQVYPLFSNEEVYTNAEDPETHTILPGLNFYNETTWSDTPAVGIFNVVYTVEFEGVTQQVKKMVIKCPIWLLFIIIFAIIALIIFIILKAKNRGKKGSRAKASE